MIKSAPAFRWCWKCLTKDITSAPFEAVLEAYTLRNPWKNNWKTMKKP